MAGQLPPPTCAFTVLSSMQEKLCFVTVSAAITLLLDSFVAMSTRAREAESQGVQMTPPPEIYLEGQTWYFDPSDF